MLLLDSITELQLFVAAFAWVYVLALLLHILSQWVAPALPYAFRPVTRFLYDICEPYLRFWRRIVPLQVGPLDFSPYVALFAIWIGAQVLNSILNQLH